MHFALEVQQFPVASVSWITEKFLPTVNGRGDLIKSTDQAFYTATRIVSNDLPVYKKPMATQFAFFRQEQRHENTIAATPSIGTTAITTMFNLWCGEPGDRSW
jgi:hypothetical protein